MNADQIKKAYQDLEDRVLEAGHPYYYPLYTDDSLVPYDPLDQLIDTVEMASRETYQLFSGFRGIGKSTELRRFKQQLEQNDTHCRVIICDMAEYLNFTSPLDVSDFLLAITGAFSDAVAAPEYLGDDPSRASYWARFWHYLKTTDVELDSLGLNFSTGMKPAKVGAVIKANLREDPSFLQRLQGYMKGRFGTLRAHVQRFFDDTLKALRNHLGDPRLKLVLVFDSIEHYRGTSKNEKDVADSVECLFRGHANALRIPFIHTVYTVPPWLRLRTPGLDCDCYQQLPCVKVRTREGERFQPGLDALKELVTQRFEWDKLLTSTEFDQLALASGGYMRDLLRLFQQGLRFSRRQPLPLKATTVELILTFLRNAYKDSFTNEESVWLTRIDDEGQPNVDVRDQYLRLAHFFDTHFVLAYGEQGEIWYALHPIIRDLVRQRAEEFARRPSE